jgi:hypothetical protein
MACKLSGKMTPVRRMRKSISIWKRLRMMLRSKKLIREDSTTYVRSKSKDREMNSMRNSGKLDTRTDTM